MEPDAMDDPPQSEILNRLFAACLEVLICGPLAEGLKFRALVSISLAYRAGVVTKESLAKAFEEVETAIDEGVAGEPKLAGLLGLDHGGDHWRRIRAGLDMKGRIAAIKNKGEVVGSDDTFRGTFSKHANQVMGFASYVAAQGLSKNDGVVKDYTEYKILCVDEDKVVYAIRPHLEIRPNTHHHRKISGQVTEMMASRFPTGWANGEPEPVAPPEKAPRVLSGRSQGEFCRFTQSFIDEHRANVRIQDDRKFPLRLFYLLIRVRDFEAAKHGIQALANDHCRTPEPGGPEGLTDVSLWSVLGETDLLLRFRATSLEAAEDFFGKAAARLVDDNSGEVGPDSEPRLIVVDRELVNGLYALPKAIKSFYEASKHHLVHLDMNEHRYTKYFIIIKYSNNPRKPKLAETHVQDVRGIIEPSTELASIVESISPATDRRNSGEACMVIEGQLPCGMFSRLKTLSKKLEAEVSGGRGSKETFVAYEMVFHDHHERDLRLTGIA